MTDKEYYKPQDIADLLDVKILTVYRWIKDGKLKAVKIGQWRISKEALHEFIGGGQNK